MNKISPKNRMRGVYAPGILFLGIFLGVHFYESYFSHNWRLRPV